MQEEAAMHNRSVGVDENSVEILVVGAGPVGLTLACELLRYGIRCRIIDQAQEPAQTSRALGIHVRTMEIFARMGLADSLLTHSGTAWGADVYNAHGKELLHVHLHFPTKVKYPFLTIVPQQQTEQVMRERLTELGGEIEWGHELVDVRQNEQGMCAIVARHTAGQTDSEAVEEIRAQYVVGCDGAHSRVRKAVQIPFEGRTIEDEFLLADVDLDWQVPHERARFWLHPEGVFIAIPLPGGNHWRLIVNMHGKTSAEVSPVSLEYFQQLLVERTGDTQTRISNPIWMSRFRINQRLVKMYAKGRVFLAGDAAHIHSPAGGQGMNTGIQDAYNLAWKLALVVRKQARAQLLASYQEERKPVARTVVGATGLVTDLIISANPVVQWAREHIVFPLAATKVVQQIVSIRVSELDINYHSSSLSQTYRGSQPSQTATARPKVRQHFQSPPRVGNFAPLAQALRYPTYTPVDLPALGNDARGGIILLFAGVDASEEEMKRLAKLACEVRSACADLCRVYLVLAGSEVPRELPWDGEILCDPTLHMYKRYGARRELLYYIRPDGYIGFRSQPVSVVALKAYLHERVCIAKE